MNASNYLSQIKILYWSILMALVFMLVLGVWAVAHLGAIWSVPASDKETFKTILILLSLLAIPAGYKFHQKRISHLNPELSFPDKLKNYRSSFFIKIVSLEALAIIALTGYLFTADYVFLIIFGLLFVAFAINMPSKKRIELELEQDNPI